MPLSSGSSRETISENISEMVHAGHPQEQAVAAALRKSREDEERVGRLMDSVGHLASRFDAFLHRYDAQEKLWLIRGFGKSGGIVEMKLRAPDHASAQAKATRLGVSDIRDTVLLQD